MNNLSIIKKITFLFLFFIVKSTFSQKPLIKNGDEWNYYDNDYLENDWYEDSNLIGWKTGVTPIGYGDQKIVTKINFGEDLKNKHTVKYFKKNITISKEKLVAFEFKFQRDDGIVIYINNKELFRDNMPNSTINKNTLAKTRIDKAAENKFNARIFSTSIFKEGLNTISVSIHQYTKTSSDCIFNLELIAHDDLKFYQ